MTTSDHKMNPDSTDVKQDVKKKKKRNNRKEEKRKEKMKVFV